MTVRFGDVRGQRIRITTDPVRTRAFVFVVFGVEKTLSLACWDIESQPAFVVIMHDVIFAESMFEQPSFDGVDALFSWGEYVMDFFC